MVVLAVLGTEPFYIDYLILFISNYVKFGEPFGGELASSLF
jgi:hypothetical protein